MDLFFFFFDFQITSLKNTSTEDEVVNSLEKLANATKGPSGHDSLTDGELTTVSQSLESVANLLNSSSHLVSNDVAKVSLLEGVHTCTVPQNFKLRPMRYICFDLVKACEGVFLLCFLGRIVT